jgi:hypothetical protein
MLVIFPCVLSVWVNVQGMVVCCVGHGFHMLQQKPGVDCGGEVAQVLLGPSLSIAQMLGKTIF